MFTIKTLSASDLPLLLNIADDVFDNPVNESFAREFLADPRHHIVVALVGGVVIGFAGLSKKGKNKLRKRRKRSKRQKNWRSLDRQFS
jgi:hypothetical protein